MLTLRDALAGKHEPLQSSTRPQSVLIKARCERGASGGTRKHPSQLIGLIIHGSESRPLQPDQEKQTSEQNDSPSEKSTHTDEWNFFRFEIVENWDFFFFLQNTENQNSGERSASSSCFPLEPSLAICKTILPLINISTTNVSSFEFPQSFLSPPPF